MSIRIYNQNYMKQTTTKPIKIQFEYHREGEEKFTRTLNSQFSQASINPSLISTFSHSSSRRIQQILPKQKINIQNIHSKCTLKHDTLSKNNKILTQYRKKTQSLDYRQIKPIISWKKYGHLFCGMEKGRGDNGCSCDIPCKWMKLWTNSYKQQNYKLFKNLPWKQVQEKNYRQIGKDISRTHSDCPTFQSSNYQEMLKEVLIAYSIYDSQVGYVQGMNMVVGVMLYHIKNSELTFWAFVEIMQQQQLRMIYLDGFEHLKEHCRNITNILISRVNDLFNLMKQMNIESEVFLYGWLLSLMSTCIPLEYMHFVVDSFRRCGWKFIYQLVITYLLYIKEGLLMVDDSCQFLNVLNNTNARDLGIEWHQMIQASHNLMIDWQFLV